MQTVRRQDTAISAMGNNAKNGHIIEENAVQDKAKDIFY
jgi:hypothetical protein